MKKVTHDNSKTGKAAAALRDYWASKAATAGSDSARVAFLVLLATANAGGIGVKEDE